jgi:hydrogenase maturation protease
MIFVLGIGNRLRSDDGAGAAAIDKLTRDHALKSRAIFQDGGTIGLALLPQIEDSSGFIVIDAAQLNEAPGVIRVFEGEAMDIELAGGKRTVHEVSVLSLFSAAALAGALPKRRALVAIQPATTGWGVSLSPAVSIAIPAACDAVARLIARWEAEAEEPALKEDTPPSEEARHVRRPDIR